MTTQTRWQDLHVEGQDGDEMGTLGALVERNDPSLVSIVVAENGIMREWPDHMLALPACGATHAIPIDGVSWWGFREALTRARENRLVTADEVHDAAFTMRMREEESARAAKAYFDARQDFEKLLIRHLHIPRSSYGTDHEVARWYIDGTVVRVSENRNGGFKFEYEKVPTLPRE